jgi:dTDP-4-dehydrorhamnose 3,5-epimerase
MEILNDYSLSIEDVKVIEFARFRDNRGYFTEHYRKDASELFKVPFVQCNESFSETHVMRGLHFQWNPFMGKLIRTVYGHMIDMVMDIRKGSPTFGKILLHDMPSDEYHATGEWIWVPPGFAHGNFFLRPTFIEYFCSGEYSPGCEAGISPLSEDIDWSLVDPSAKSLFDQEKLKVILSEKDKNGMTLTEWSDDERSNNFIYGEC